MTAVAAVTRSHHAHALHHHHAAAAVAGHVHAHGNRAIATSFMAAPRTALKDMSVKERFATIQSRFDPSAAKGVDVKFQFDISGEGGGKWYCTIKGGKLTVVAGTGPNPTATLHAKASDYLKIANGQMNKIWALVQGKLRVEGDKEALKKWDTYFKD